MKCKYCGKEQEAETTSFLCEYCGEENLGKSIFRFEDDDDFDFDMRETRYDIDTKEIIEKATNLYGLEVFSFEINLSGLPSLCTSCGLPITEDENDIGLCRNCKRQLTN